MDDIDATDEPAGAMGSAYDTHNNLKETLKLLLDAHEQELQPEYRQVGSGTLLLRQGEISNKLVLLTAGTVEVQLRSNVQSRPHTLARVEAEQLLGEMALFGNAPHSADVRVVDGEAEVLILDGDRCLQAMLYDVEIAIEMLEVISQRCLRSNTLVAGLLDGLVALNNAPTEALTTACDQLNLHGHGLQDAAQILEGLAQRLGPTP
jgi:CRP/FNR family cyclic AMP-dependent transcriptional regulator